MNSKILLLPARHCKAFPQLHFLCPCYSFHFLITPIFKSTPLPTPTAKGQRLGSPAPLESSPPTVPRFLESLNCFKRTHQNPSLDTRSSIHLHSFFIFSLVCLSLCCVSYCHLFLPYLHLFIVVLWFCLCEAVCFKQCDKWCE